MKKNAIRDVGSTADLVLVYLVLLVPTGTSGNPLVPTGTHWYLLVPPGTRWYPLVPVGTPWNPLVPPGTRLYLLVCVCTTPCSYTKL